MEATVQALLARPRVRKEARDWSALESSLDILSTVRRRTLLQIIVQPDLPLGLFMTLLNAYFMDTGVLHGTGKAQIDFRAVIRELWGLALEKHVVVFSKKGWDGTSIKVPRIVFDIVLERTFLSISSMDELHDENWNACRISEAFWKTIHLLHLLHKGQEKQPENHLLMNMAISIGLPNFILYFIAKMYPKELEQSDHQRTGTTPLQLAVEHMAQGFYTTLSDEETWNFQSPATDFSILAFFGHQSPIPLLCHLCPQAARRALGSATETTIQRGPKDPCQVARGMLPLETLLYATYERERTEISRRYINVRRTPWEEWRAVLNGLISAAPESLETRHPQTFLYPFLVPAQKPQVDKDPWWDQFSLNLIFFLLRNNPVLISLYSQP